MLSPEDDLPIAGEKPCVQTLELGDVGLDDGICEILHEALVMPVLRIAAIARRTRTELVGRVLVGGF